MTDGNAPAPKSETPSFADIDRKAIRTLCKELENTLEELRGHL